MKKILVLLSTTLVITYSSAQQTDISRLTVQFDKLLSAQFKTKEPGATALVSRKGQVIYKKAFGMANQELNVPMQVNNVFRIGSITKQFTAVAILQLAESGKLALQDEITRFIPDYPTQGSKITIEHLLSHTSSIRDFTSIGDSTIKGTVDYTPKQMIDLFKNKPMRFSPGTKWEYSNSNYFLLGYIIELLSGKTYDSYLEENFFKPLGMKNSLYASESLIIKNRADGYTKTGKEYENAAYISMTHPYAAGSILSTVEDLFIWQQALLSGKLLKKESLTQASTKYLLNDGTATAYGYGWRLGNIYESPSIWHGGLINGFISIALYLPKEDIFVAVLSNCDCNSPVEVSSKLAALAMGKSFEYKEIPLKTAALQEYAGVYENNKGQQQILTLSDKRLYSQINRGPKSHIKSFQKDRFFFVKDSMLNIRFARNSMGNVEKLITESLRGNEEWTRTGKPIPGEDGIKLEQNVLENYVGQYEVSPQFSFVVTREGTSLFLQASGQEKLEMFAESGSKFFLKVNDATLEFVRDKSGVVFKVVLYQGGRNTDAKKVK